MGYIRHDAIIVTSWDGFAIHAAADKAKEIGLEIIGPSAPAVNGYRTFTVVPDGSKEGWSDSDIGDERRDALIRYLDSIRHSDG